MSLGSTENPLLIGLFLCVSQSRRLRVRVLFLTSCERTHAEREPAGRGRQITEDHPWLEYAACRTFFLGNMVRIPENEYRFGR